MEDRKEEVQKFVNDIIKSLYGKNGKVGKRCKFIDEPINWGDLSCFEVKQDIDGTFVVFIDEASPDCCNFNRFIEAELKKKGIEADVITEW
jgi:hypothetical protein